MRKIVFVHSLNNYTGSPNVLSMVVRGLVCRGYSAEIITSRNEGFLSYIERVDYRYTCYRWSNNQITTMFWLLISQFEMFFHCLSGSKKHIYYINTIIPFGAIIACWLTRKRYVIHVHENMQQLKPLYRILKYVYRICNQKSIFVSDYLEKQAVNCRNGVVIYNALPDHFFEIANRSERNGKTILMISSLRRFKGVYEFATLAQMLPSYSFELVLSADKDEVKRFEAEVGVIPNLIVYSYQTDVHPFYQRAKLLLQLSDPKSWIETFGLTILEAMAYGIPAIVPPVGGPIELIIDGENGYVADPHNLDLIRAKIEALMNEDELYEQLSTNALRKSKQYTQTKMITEIEQYII